MIRFEQLSPEMPDGEFSLVFFTSPQAVKSFYTIFPDSRLDVAVLGEGTARHLPAHIRPVFTGRGEAATVVAEFAAQNAGAKVLIPRGDRSLRRLQKALSPEQYTEILIYRTLEHPQPVPDCKVYAFTSPSNVDAFFRANTISADAVCVALGSSTAEALVKHGKNPRIAEDYGQKALAEAIFSGLDS